VCNEASGKIGKENAALPMGLTRGGPAPHPQIYPSTNISKKVGSKSKTSGFTTIQAYHSLKTFIKNKSKQF